MNFRGKPQYLLCPRGIPLGNEVPLQVAERIEQLLNA